MPDAVKGRRPYRSDRRAEQARSTRRAVVAAATRLFVDHGYGATSLQQVAEEAGVSVNTIYVSFGNKRHLLEEAIDVAIAGDDEPVVVNERDWMREVFTHPEPGQRMVAYAAACRRIMTSAGDLFAVLNAAATIDPALQEVLAEADQRRRNGARSIIGALAAIGGLRHDLDEGTAVDILWTCNSPEIFNLLVRRSGWDVERYERWLAATLQDQLLGPSARQRRPRTRSGPAA
jgi:AcrR family transcriptional regulator